MTMLSKYEDRVHLRLILDAKIILNYFLKYKLPPFEIAKITGVSEEIVINILNDQELLQEVMPNDSKINMKVTNILAYQSRDVNFCFLPIVLDLFNGKKKWQFLAMLILTFRLHLPELAQILKMDEEELFQMLNEYNPQLKKAFNYLFVGDNYHQDIANQRLINYISEYYDAWKNKDEIRIKELLMYINDTEYNELLKNYHQEQLTNEQLLILINNQLKYALQVGEVVMPLNISKTKYLDPVKFFITDKDELQERLSNLSRYNMNLARTNRGKHE